MNMDIYESLILNSTAFQMYYIIKGGGGGTLLVELLVVEEVGFTFGWCVNDDHASRHIARQTSNLEVMLQLLPLMRVRVPPSSIFFFLHLVKDSVELELRVLKRMKCEYGYI